MNYQNLGGNSKELIANLATNKKGETVSKNLSYMNFSDIKYIDDVGKIAEKLIKASELNPQSVHKLSFYNSLTAML